MRAGGLAALLPATTEGGLGIDATVELPTIKRQGTPTTTFQVPTWVPYVGVVAATGMFVTEVLRIAF